MVCWSLTNIALLSSYNKEFLPDSFTTFKNKIGLAVEDRDTLKKTRSSPELAL